MELVSGCAVIGIRAQGQHVTWSSIGDSQAKAEIDRDSDGFDGWLDGWTDGLD